MAKAPAFQFYVRDWLSDSQLRRTSASTRGIWADLLCYMWDAPNRGELIVTRADLRKMTGASNREIARFITEAESIGFCDISVTCHTNLTKNNTYVTLRNRRMYREEKDRISNKLRQRQCRERKRCHTQCHGKITPPSSSSSSFPPISPQGDNAQKGDEKKQFEPISEETRKVMKKLTGEEE